MLDKAVSLENNSTDMLIISGSTLMAQQEVKTNHQVQSTNLQDDVEELLAIIDRSFSEYPSESVHLLVRLFSALYAE